MKGAAATFVATRMGARGRRAASAFGAALAILRFARKLSGSEPKVLYRHRLSPGDVLVVRHPKDEQKARRARKGRRSRKEQ